MTYAARGVVVLAALTATVAAQRQQRPSYRIAIGEVRGVYIARTVSSLSQVLVPTTMASVPVNGWSPDGSRLAFFALTDADRAATCRHALHRPLYVVRAATSEVKPTPAERLTDLVQAIEPEFAWARDDRRIAFSSGCEDPNGVQPRDGARDGQYASALYVADATSRQARRLTEFVHARFPSWSPDGRQIAYSQPETPGGPPAVFVMDSDGTDARKLAAGWRPAWSPQGDLIAFISHAKNAPGTFVVRLDGTGLKQIAPYISPAIRWSPDGARILVPGSSAVLVDIAAGSRNDLGELVDARFAPDGKLILFSAPDGIWSADLKGDNKQRLLPWTAGPRLSTFSADHPR